MNVVTNQQPPPKSSSNSMLLIGGRANSDAFEADVRRIARELFPSSGGYSAVMVDGRERDGVIDDGETIHIIEATRDTRKNKAETDISKSVELKRSLARNYESHNFKIWFITEKDPTADQALVAENARRKARCPVVAMSYASFGQKIVDTANYLAARQNYPFGSIRSPDPSSPNAEVGEGDFVPLGLIDAKSKSSHSPDDVATQLRTSPGIYVLVGDFGAGKSMTMRHIFFKLRDSYRRHETIKFPVYLNLRDHIGQDVAASALHDHGSRIGFARPECLVRAWRAGFVDLILDGFDEIASSRFRSDGGGLRAVRSKAMRLIREFISEHNVEKSSIFICGRENYFGSMKERDDALGLSGRTYKSYSLNEFTVEQIQEYLSRLGASDETVPDWLPSRPLLVGYLALRNILTHGSANLGSMSRAEGWDYILDQIALREGNQISDLGGQVAAIRPFIDRLATTARLTSSGRGPISIPIISSTFRSILPSSPDETAQQLLLRLAGLTVAANAGNATPSAVVAHTPDQEDAREFIDADLVDAARAGDVVRFIDYPYDDSLNALFSDGNCLTVMSDLGIEVAIQKLRHVSFGKIWAALKQAATKINSPSLAMDIVNILKTYDHIGDSIIKIRGGYFDEFDVSNSVSLTNIYFSNCLFSRINIDSSEECTGPTFEHCEIDTIYGCAGEDDLPSGMFDRDNSVSAYKFHSIAEGGKVPDELSPAVRVLVGSLHKLFTQAGKGRKENAFFRGLNETEKVYVHDVLAIIHKNNIATPFRLSGPIVWIPNRSKTKEVHSILNAPQVSNHPALISVKKL